MISYKEKLNTISTFIFDVDGVLTDGKVYLFKDEIVRLFIQKMPMPFSMQLKWATIFSLFLAGILKK